jgi:hypothetical protein
MDEIKGGKQLILAIYPNARGFGYALFEGPDRPVEWGLKKVRYDKNRGVLSRADRLIRWFKPDLLILEDAAARGSRRAPRIRSLVNALRNNARKSNLRVHQFSRRQIKLAFADRNAVTKDEIARSIANQFPEFEACLPPPRKLWMSEDPKLGIFGAVSLIAAFFHCELTANPEGQRVTTR